MGAAVGKVEIIFMDKWENQMLQQWKDINKSLESI